MQERESLWRLETLFSGARCRMKYGEAVKKSMEELAKDPRTFFIGYNLIRGSKGYGSLKDIPKDKIIETPVAENLMAGLGIGMAITNLRPVVIYERHDFILNALDAIVNHLGKFNELSEGQYNPPVIIRAIVGSKTPIDPGPQHNQDFTSQLESMVNFSVYDPACAKEIISTYKKIQKQGTPAIVIERRDLYNKN